MYLNTFQKMLIRKLNEKENNGIFEEILEILNLQKANLSYNCYSISNGQSFSRFIYRFKAKNQEIKFFPGETQNNPYACLTTNVTLPIRKANQERGITDQAKEGREIEDKHQELLYKEVASQQVFIQKLQEKTEETIHLVGILSKNNLIISYEKNIPEGLVLGSILDDKNYWVDELEISCSKNGNLDRLFLTLDKFLRTQIIILPGLMEFQQHNFQTFEELNRKKELQRLKIQTFAVVIGIFVSAMITLLAVVISHPNASDVKTITESINELTVEVDELTPNVQQNELNIPIMPDAISDQSIQPKTIL